ncbi:MAG: carboxypeptidase-like regulatory domain-containing protein, partial [Flavobacterium sp.]
MKTDYSIMKKTGLIIALLLFNLGFSQNSTLSGIVSDETGSPIPGVNVSLKNSAKGSTTDLDGKYLFSGLQNGNVIIITSYIGYKTTQTNTKIDGNTVQNISLLEDANVLDDVIITGVVNPKSRLESSVSVSSIGIKQIEQSAPRSTGEVFRNIPG